MMATYFTNTMLHFRAFLLLSLFAMMAPSVAQTTLLFDDFEDGDLTVGGAGTTNGGFTIFRSDPPNDTVAEANGFATISVTENFRRSGMYSNTALDIVSQAPNGVTATWEFDSITLPTSGQLAHMRVGLGDLFFSVRRENDGEISYSLGSGWIGQPGNTRNGHQYTVDLVGNGDDNNTGFNVTGSTLDDGFSVLIAADPTGWELSLPGADLNGTPISHSGTWAAAGLTYNDVFDGTFIDGREADDFNSVDVTGALVLNEVRRQDRDFTSNLASVTIVADAASTTLFGDYNDDKVVDLADYTVWRNNVGSSATLPNDNIGGVIGVGQYDQWRTNFGSGSGSVTGVSSAVVPEPTSAALVSILIVGSLLRRRNLR